MKKKHPYVYIKWQEIYNQKINICKPARKCKQNRYSQFGSNSRMSRSGQILKCKGQIRVHASVTAINFFFPLHGIVVLNN